MRSLDYISLVKFVAFMATLVELVGSNSTEDTQNDVLNNGEKELTKPLDSW